MHHKFVIYPFSALVGQELMKKALLINAVEPSVGGVLIKGDKGTGKSTAVRALADLLGDLEIVSGCPFNCHPVNKRLMCKTCQEQIATAGSLPVVTKKMEIVDMPLSATEDMVIGSINIKKALQEGTKALEPGLLARANRNVLYIDEVNLLDDYLVNILLDAAAMGVNVVEREGISLFHPARFILVGTMNPEEGELRPQIIDRFGLSVEVAALQTTEERLLVLDNRRKFDDDPHIFEQEYCAVQKETRKTILRAGELLPHTELSREKLLRIVNLVSSLGIKTHRADIIMDKTTRVLAALDGRTVVNEQDIREAAQLALAHRMRQDPLKRGEQLSPEMIDELLDDEKELPQSLENKQLEQQDNKSPSPNGVLPAEFIRFNETVDKRGRDQAISESGRGQFVRARLNSEPSSLAVDATLRRTVSQSGSLQVLPEHLMEKVRISKGKALYILALDTSSSMRMERKIRLAKNLAGQLLQRSYQKKNRVALLTFREDDARMFVPPTTDMTSLFEALQALPTGGKTPLTLALFKAFEVAGKESGAASVAVIISDGKANVFRGAGLDDDLHALGAFLQDLKMKLIFINTENKKRSLEVLEKMSDFLGGDLFYLEDLL